MNEDLQSALLGLVDDIKSAKDFAIEQAPDVVQQMVTYHATVAWIWVAVGCLLASVSLIGCLIFRHGIKDGDADLAGVGFFSALIPLLFGGAVVLFNLKFAIKATFYPKWFIVEHIMKMVG